MQLTKSKLDLVDELQKEIAALLVVPEEMENYFGHVSDAVYEKASADDLFKRLGIDLPPTPAREGVVRKNK